MRIHLIATLVATVAIALVPAAAQGDLIAEYKFDGDTTDATGNGNDGVAEGDAAYAGPGSMWPESCTAWLTGIHVQSMWTP